MLDHDLDTRVSLVEKEQEGVSDTLAELKVGQRSIISLLQGHDGNNGLCTRVRLLEAGTQGKTETARGKWALYAALVMGGLAFLGVLVDGALALASAGITP